MALGRAFIDVDADLAPFKKTLNKEVPRILKETEGVAAKQGAASGEKFAGGFDKSNRQKGQEDTKKTSRFLGDEFVKGFLKSVVGGIESAPPVVQATLIGILIASLPLFAIPLGAALTTLFITALGLVNIGAGIALVFRSPAIKEAAKALGGTILTELTNAASVFIKPLQKAFNILGSEFKQFLPVIEGGFRLLAPLVDDLAKGFGGFLQQLGPGLREAFQAAAPLVLAFAKELPRLGKVLTIFFQKLSENREELALAFILFFRVLENLIVFIGEVFEKLVQGADALLSIFRKVASVLGDETMVKNIDNLRVEADAVANSTIFMSNEIGALGDELNQTAEDTALLTTALAQLFTEETGLDSATIAYNESLLQLQASLKENGKDIRLNTQAGLANRTAILGVVNSLISMRDAEVEAGGKVSDANKKFENQVAQLEKVLRKAGFTKDQINELIGEYKKVPTSVKTNIELVGTEQAIALAKATLLKMAKALSGGVRIRLNPSSDRNRPGAFAMGGVVTEPTMALVGEAGPEAILPLNNPRRAAEVARQAGLGLMFNRAGNIINVTAKFEGAIPTEREAFKIGQSLGAGIHDAIIRSNVSTRIRAI